MGIEAFEHWILGASCRDGTVSGGDLAIVLEAWGTDCGR